MKILFLLQNNVKIYKYVMEKKHFFSHLLVLKYSMNGGGTEGN